MNSRQLKLLRILTAMFLLIGVTFFLIAIHSPTLGLPEWISLEVARVFYKTYAVVSFILLILSIVLRAKE